MNSRTTNDRLQDHWRWRPDWSPDRPNLWWYLTFEDQPKVREAAAVLAAPLDESPIVDVIPPAFLHLTVQELGFVDAFEAHAVQDVLAEVRGTLASLPSFQLELRLLSYMPGAVVLEAASDERVSELRSCLPASPAADAARELETQNLAPHVSIGYVNRDCDARLVMDQLPQDIEPVTVDVCHVTLAAVTRRDKHYQWEVRDTIDLAPKRLSLSDREGR